MKEIPSGSDLQAISRMLPGKFETVEDAVACIIEVLQKGKFDTIHLTVNDGDSALNLGYIEMSGGPEMTEGDKSRIIGLGGTGAELLSRLPARLAFDLLAGKFHDQGKDGLAGLMAMMAGMAGAAEGHSDGDEEEGCGDPTCSCHEHDEEPEAPIPPATEPSPWD